MHSTNNIFLIKPANFGYNSETAKSNAFQKKVVEDSEMIARNVIHEFDQMAKKLTEKGINVMVIEDSKYPIKPDAIFPNNWGSFHSDGNVILYPMLAKNRRMEKRNEVLEQILKKFDFNEIIDLSEYEKQNMFLEGTGSIIFDHNSKIAYACLSPRTDSDLFTKTCSILGYKPVFFNSIDKLGKEIYHTNVMMNIGNGYAVICLESISDKPERERVKNFLKSSGKELIDISYDQMNSFCGNMIELEVPHKKNILVMSQSAFNSLKSSQKNALEQYCELFPINVATIEKIGGGSVRCMISEIFLTKKINVKGVLNRVY